MKKYDLVSALAEETAGKVAASEENWRGYLDTASRLYRYRFQDQLLIHAQRPDATACASMQIWNERMHCWVNRGAKGIALIDEQSIGKIKYVFDISDVHRNRRGGRFPNLWEMRKEYESPVLARLEELYGETDPAADFPGRIQELAERIASDYTEEAASAMESIKKGSFLEKLDSAGLRTRIRDTLSSSIAYTVLKRCGLDSTELKKRTGFPGIREFNTLNTLSQLGTCVSDLSGPVLMETGRVVRNCELKKEKGLAIAAPVEYNALKRESKAVQRQSTTETGKTGEGSSHDEPEVRAERGLPDSHVTDGRAAGGDPNEIRPDAAEVPEGAPEGDLHGSSAAGQAEGAPAGSPGAGGAEDGASDRTDESSAGRDRTAQGREPDAVGAEDEQHPAFGRRNRAGRTDLQLNNGEKQPDGEDLPGFSFHHQGPEAQQGELRPEELYPEKPRPEKIQQGEPQLSEPEGTYQQLSLFPSLEEQMGTIAVAEADTEYIRPVSFSLRQEHLEAALRSGSGRRDSRKRIYAKYRQGKTPGQMAQFLKQEYGTTGKGFDFDGHPVSFWFDETGMRAGYGTSAKTDSFTAMGWEKVERYIRAMVVQGTYMDAGEVLLVDGAEKKRVAGDLYCFFRDGIGEMPDSLGISTCDYQEGVAGFLELLETAEGRERIRSGLCTAQEKLDSGKAVIYRRYIKGTGYLMDQIADLDTEKTVYPAADRVEVKQEDFITGDEIDACLTGGSGLENGRFRIYEYFREEHDRKETIVFLKKEYGQGGRSHALPGSDFAHENHDSRGIRLEKSIYGDPCAKILLGWSAVEKRIRELVRKDQYLDPDGKKAYAQYKQKQAEKAGKREPAEHLENAASGEKTGAVKKDGRDATASADIKSSTDKKDSPDAGNVPETKDSADAGNGPETKDGADVRNGLETKDSADAGNGSETKDNADAANGREAKGGTDTETAQPSPDKTEATNFHITYREPEQGRGFSPKEKFRQNIQAIRTLKRIESENRPATPEEQQVLAQYAGWGGLPDAFDKTRTGWKKEYQELKALLSPEEYASARESTLNALYTSPAIIRCIYDAIRRMGFTRGNILEPAMGTGNFFGMLPETMGDSRLYGVELDSLTGRIAKKLYPRADVQVTGFEKTRYPSGFFDIAVGNVPFGQYRVADRVYDRYNFQVHDYFFAKTLDKVRPGGIIAFITSKGTMDKQNPAARHYLAQRAELLGAVRLPNTAFKDHAGTEATADILFLKKRDRMADLEPEWVHLAENEDGIAINAYFVRHPEMVLGKMEMVSGPYGMEATCVPDLSTPLAERLEHAVSRIGGRMEEPELEEREDGDMQEVLPASPDVRNYSYTLVDGRVYYREDSVMRPMDVPETTRARICGMVQIRDCVQELIRLQLEEAPDSAVKERQAELNTLYDIFIRHHGRISSQANRRAFSQDSGYFLLCSLEKLDEEGRFTGKADMFHKRTIKRHETITHVDTAGEALAVSLGERAGVDLAYMADLAGKTEEEVIKELDGIIFQNPVTGQWETADQYLSGNVREKLETARISAENHPEYAPNVQALEHAQPRELEASEIGVRIGATWIEPRYMEDFIREVLGTPGYLFTRSQMGVHYSGATGQWYVEGKTMDQGNALVRMTYGTARASAYRILEDSLNLRDTRVFDTVTDGEGREKRVLNKKETILAGQKQEALREAFKDWVFRDPERRRELCRVYNRLFNSTRPREYDGSHLKFPGMTPDIELKPHQLNAVARQLYGGNTLLAHCVGAGKTFEMIAAAMESRRLGLCQKSLFVVPNHLTGQWAADFLRLYPGAGILAATKKDFEPARRKKFCSRIATGDYDAVIIGHSQFEKIPLSGERQAAMIQRQIAEIGTAIETAKGEKGERYTVKQMERTRKSLQARLERLGDSSRKDDVVTFEQLGVDRLFVDESHHYKNLFLYTKMRNVAGIPQTEAQKSSDMFAKCQYLDELTGGKGITFATGTPISNSMTELYTSMRYLQYGTLQKLGLGNFDSWASSFGETQTAIELAPEGTGYRAKTRFARFFNLPELVALFKECADIQTPDMLKLPVPEAEYETVVLKPSIYQQEMVATLAERAEAVRNRLVDPQEDNMLKITSDGRKLALDQRLADSTLPDDPGSKAAACVERAFAIWNRTMEQRSAQMIFCDLSIPKGDGTFNVYGDIRSKLVGKGVPPGEIAFIHEADTELQKAELFARVRSGQVRFLLGSTQKMGAGTNVQDRLVALHHLDVPWRPSDIEQQEGRILRQGNRNPRVKIFRYVTEGTFDSYSWQVIEGKQRFIGQIMTSRSPVRSCEDVDEAALTYAEVKALATGNPHMKEKMDLDIQVGRLKLVKAAHTSQKYLLEEDIAWKYPAQIAALEKETAGLSRDAAAAAEVLAEARDHFSMTIGKRVYTDRKEAGAALTAAGAGLKQSGPDGKVGDFHGFTLEAGFDSHRGKYMLTVRRQCSYPVELGRDPLGNLQRISHALEGIGKRRTETQQKLESLQKQFATAREEAAKPFPKEEELKEKLARLAELDALLSLDGKEDGAEAEGAEIDGEETKETETEGVKAEKTETEETEMTGTKENGAEAMETNTVKADAVKAEDTVRQEESDDADALEIHDKEEPEHGTGTPETYSTDGLKVKSADHPDSQSTTGKRSTDLEARTPREPEEHRIHRYSTLEDLKKIQRKSAHRQPERQHFRGGYSR